MQYRPLGDLEVSVIGLGCNNFGRLIDEESAVAVVRAAVDSGVTLFDTADVYGTGDEPFSGTGRSEEYLGKAVGEFRDRVVIATKFGGRAGERGLIQPPGRPGSVIGSCEASLRRLQTDYIDLYQMHVPDRDTPIEATLGALSELVEAGKVRHFGVSNMTRPELIGASGAGSTYHAARPVSLQGEYSLIAREIEAELLPTCLELGIGFLPYFPLASGLLTGKYLAGSSLSDTRLSSWVPREHFRRTDRLNAYLSSLDEFARTRGHTMLDLAFAWLLSRSPVVSVIAGARNAEQVETNARRPNWTLSATELEEVDSLWHRFSQSV